MVTFQRWAKLKEQTIVKNGIILECREKPKCWQFWWRRDHVYLEETMIEPKRIVVTIINKQHPQPRERVYNEKRLEMVENEMLIRIHKEKDGQTLEIPTHWIFKFVIVDVDDSDCSIKVDPNF